MKDVARMFVATAVAAVVFVGLYVLLHWSLVISLLLAIGIYIGLTLFLKPSRKIAGIDVAEMPGGEALADLLDEADNDLTSIRSATKRILEPQVREQAQALYTTGTRICDYLEENPQKIRLARRFLTYYLDTTAKLLDRYVELSETGLRTGEVAEILAKTAQALPVLNDAFARQFTHLMEGELMDVEADLALLKSTLEMEGGK